jgi:hypothetical protein
LVQCLQKPWFWFSGLKFSFQIFVLFGVRHIIFWARDDNFIIYKQYCIQLHYFSHCNKLVRLWLIQLTTYFCSVLALTLKSYVVQSLQVDFHYVSFWFYIKCYHLNSFSKFIKIHIFNSF